LTIIDNNIDIININKERHMSNEEKELLEQYRDMLSENQTNVLAFIRGMHIAQENTRRRLMADYGIIGKEPPPAKRPA
jgi:hypothetical protein